MSTSSSTSSAGTGIRPTPTSHPRSRFDPDGDWRSDAAGKSYTKDSTTPEAPPTTSTSDCDLEFLFQAGDPHPVGLVCRTHDMTFDIGTGI